MSYWQGGGLLTLLSLGLIFALTTVVRRNTQLLQRTAMPDCMFAGMLCWLLGPQFVGLLPLDATALEDIVYHGLAVLFIAVGLQSPPQAQAGQSSLGVKSVALSVPVNAVCQGLFGLGLVLLFSAFGAAVHPGMGLLFPLAFNQGPGQALSLGSAWEQSGLVNGGQIGLIIATLGLLVGVVVGVPLVAWGRHKGWVSAAKKSGGSSQVVGDEASEIPEEGALEPLTAHLAVVGSTYLLVYLILKTITDALADKPQIAATFWGFHFLLSVGLALVVRLLLRRLSGGRSPLSNALLGRTAGVTVDLSTAAAMAAVQLSVLQANWVFVGTCVVVGGLGTLWMCVWLGKRAFDEEPFEHAVVLFGVATGTLTTGLALLRTLDPEMKGSTANNFVLGSTFAALGGIPLLAVMNIPIWGWPDRFLPTVLGTLGLLALYLAVLMFVWVRIGAFQWLRPLLALWPDTPERKH